METNHVLVLGGPDGGQIDVARLFESSTEFEQDKPKNGQIVRTKLNSKYFSLNLNLLLDEFPEDCHSDTVTADQKLEGLVKWYEEFSGKDCDELREVIDGLMFCIDLKYDTLEYVEQALDALDRIRESFGEDWDGFFVVVSVNGMGKPPQFLDDLDDIIALSAMEYIDFDATGVNEFSEKLGKERLLEIFQNHDWKHVTLKSNYRTNKLHKASHMTTGLLDEDKSEGEYEGEEEEIEQEDETQQTKDEEKSPHDENINFLRSKFTSTTKHNVEMDISEIFQKLQMAKDNMVNLNEEQKQDYAKKMIDEIIDYI
jgi:hypothetical protein